MRRNPVNLLLRVSAVLAVVMAVVGVRSVLWCDRLYVRTAAAQWKVESAGGAVAIERFTGWPEGLRWDYQVTYRPRGGRTPLVSYSPNGVEQYGPLVRASGAAWVQLDAAGSVDWGSRLTEEVLAFRASRPPAVAWVSFSSVQVPYWPVSVLLLLPLVAKFAAFAIRHLVESARRSRGLCVGCGYDLRASPLRCPECGRAASPIRGFDAAAGA